MAMLTIRKVDDGVKRALRERAARHGRSIEAEVRIILANAASRPDLPNLFASIRDEFDDSDWDSSITERPPSNPATGSSSTVRCSAGN